MRMPDFDDQQVLGAALAVLGLSFAGAAAVAGLVAFDHMARATELCGPAVGHCLHCAATAALAIAAIGTTATGISIFRSAPIGQRAG